MASIMRFDTLQSTQGNNSLIISGNGNISMPGSASVTGQISASKLYVPGSVIQVQHAQTSATKYTIAAADIAAIPELTISFTPKFANSRIILQSMINSSATYVSTFGFLKNGGYLSGVTNTNSQGSVATAYYGGANVESNIYGTFITYSEFPNTTSAISYSAAACSSWSGTNYTLHINDRSDSTMRSISTLTVMEIAQ